MKVLAAEASVIICEPNDEVQRCGAGGLAEKMRHPTPKEAKLSRSLVPLKQKQVRMHPFQD